MRHPSHDWILEEIHRRSGEAERDPKLNSYLGNEHTRYRITNPALREIGRQWMRAHRHLSPEEFTEVLSSLIKGESSTEKILAGMLMGYSAKSQRTFDPVIFVEWLDHLVGWAEVDAVCTGDFSITQVPEDWTTWKKVIGRLSKDNNINKRRASLVLFCSPVSRVRDERLATEALLTIDRLKSEKEIMITKAVSWLLRSMIKHYRKEVSEYLKLNSDTLPRIAARETLVKLKTGKKNI